MAGSGGFREEDALILLNILQAEMGERLEAQTTMSCNIDWVEMARRMSLSSDRAWEPRCGQVLLLTRGASAPGIATFVENVAGNVNVCGDGSRTAGISVKEADWTQKTPTTTVRGDQFCFNKFFSLRSMSWHALERLCLRFPLVDSPRIGTCEATENNTSSGRGGQALWVGATFGIRGTSLHSYSGRWIGPARRTF